MKHNLTIAGLFTVILISVYGCSSTEQQNMLSDQEKKDGWTLLFDGKTVNGWHLFNQGTIPSAWSVDSGLLICNPHAKDVKHGDLVTDKVYQDFDLRFEWKISKAGNSGLFINVQERPELATTFSTGPEYQLLDDRNAEPISVGGKDQVNALTERLRKDNYTIFGEPRATGDGYYESVV